ncbi:helix-turn-helix domain-containing protein [Sulfobacillus sp. hq2]|uniref:helix-turn-helix domain-containing protein n=2 Tax=Sulfobacillus TaxID=28033 RepID=UPI0011AF8B05|nr:helix-turn-helix domain-containing protein [Sulfobacillus sp. hq2]
MKRLPCGLANPLQFFMEIRSLGLKDNLDTTQMQLMQLLTSSPPIPPLRKQSQDLLKAAYLHREWSVAQIATHFHVSRSSFYRHKRKALEELAEAWNARH